jgi:glycosyltransferase involved in cell wall biosynthesis
VVLPCFNEAAAIDRVLPSLYRSADRLVEFNRLGEYEIIVVDDASTDESSRLLGRHERVKVLKHDARRGYGAALKTGIENARGDWIVFFDLDDSYRSADLEHLVPENRLPAPDFIFGERLSTGEGMPAVRLLGNHFFSSLVRLLYRKSVIDACSGARGFHSRWRSRVLALPNDGLDYALALTLRALNEDAHFREPAIGYLPRAGRSKLSVAKDGWRFLRVILKNAPPWRAARERA